MDLSLGLDGTHVLITGGAGFIGSSTVTAMLSSGARVTSLDTRPDQQALGPNYQYCPCDITSESALTNAFSAASATFGPNASCIALVSLDSAVETDPQSQRQKHILTARTWLRQLRAYSQANERKELKNVGLIVVGSESGSFGERGNADYASGKSAVQFGLARSLMGDVARVWPGARKFNAAAPDPVDTSQFKKECADNPNQLYLDAKAPTGLKRPVPPESVAKSILSLASENWSGSITGQVLYVDVGKQGKVMWMKVEC